ncbi:hypothetical protein PHYPSEUDO_005097 [Phytophthora pseudosyringae]|uniref:Uncharacterized protein n=1 Tax=Phytophthora pseudosyringae TaxID=221518 RepID=A0A8T1VLQ4_9STRA|nr:hypothetical protein PHYPSEUDO_005097 [Phytophthora pseudosyringae]
MSVQCTPTLGTACFAVRSTGISGAGSGTDSVVNLEAAAQTKRTQKYYERSRGGYPVSARPALELSPHERRHPGVLRADKNQQGGTGALDPQGQTGRVPRRPATPDSASVMRRCVALALGSATMKREFETIQSIPELALSIDDVSDQELLPDRNHVHLIDT